MAMRCVFGFLVLLTSAEVLRSAARTRGLAQGSVSSHRPVCHPSTRCVAKEPMTSNSFKYEVNGQQLIVEFKDGHYFSLWCNNNIKNASMLPDDSEMPAFSQPVTVKKVTFKRCLIPHSSYYDALKAFNVNVSEKLMLQELPAEPQLNVQHMRGLRITNLKINAVDSSNPPQPSFDFLDEVSELSMLDLTDVVPEPEALNRLPTTLEILRIVNGRLPVADQLRNNDNGTSWIERLNSLRLLHLVESASFVDKHPGAKLILPQLASLNNLTDLSFYYMPLDDKGLSTWLKGSSLKQLILNTCGLTSLQKPMFDDQHLTKVTLANNALRLEDGLFTPLQKSLVELDLSNTNLTDLTRAVNPLEELKILKANGNPLHSLCGNPKPVKSLLPANLPSKLQWLELKDTNATRICTDWISDRNLELMYIDLSGNQIEEIEYSDLEMMRTSYQKVQLKLMRNNLLKIKVSHENYNSCLVEQSRTPMSGEFVKKRVPVELSLDTLACDCDAYWFREVLRDCSLLTLKDDVKCNNKSEGNMEYEMLLQYGRDEIACPFSGYCMPSCSCEKRLRDNATVMRCTGALLQPPRWPETAPNFPLALHVEPRMLDHVPRLKLVELYAPDNNITNIDKDDIPPTLRKLNVSNNLISHVSLEAARALSNYGTQVWLAGNKLACDCVDVPAFSHLKHVVSDWKSTTCADLIIVTDKTESQMCYSPILPILFGVAGPLMCLVVVVLVFQRFSPRIKQFLFYHNLCLDWILKVDDTIEDPRKTHDVFLSYSYADLELLLALKSGLEKLGYSTIEHENDWGPGESVLNQIANSVIKCRRTLLLVTDNYASSDWTKEEFRSAHTHALECRSARVLIVRCNLTKPDALPKDLRLYIQQNTYLDWKDDKFWTKLCKAMPPLRQEPELVMLQDLENEKNEPLLQITYPYLRK